MFQSAPKRYVHSLIRHFVIVSLFFPTFYSHFKHEYYQDVFLANIIVFIFIVIIFSRWPLNLYRNKWLVISLSLLLLLYNVFSIYNYIHYKDVYFWKSYQINITIAFLFFLSLLVVKDHLAIVNNKVIKITIYAIIIQNLIGFYFRIIGCCKFFMMNFYYNKQPINYANSYFSWLYYDASEYALILLLCMSFFIVYKEYFSNIYTYLCGLGILVIGLLLTESTTFYLAGILLLGFEFINFLILKYNVSKKCLHISYLIMCLISIVFALLLFTYTDSFHTKYLIWKGNWELLLKDPLGLRTAFGPLTYTVPYVDIALNQGHNVFLNHMLRYSLPVGIIYTMMFLVIIVFSIIKKPGYRTIGIWIALLVPLNMDYALQTLHLPFVLYMIYCIFFRVEMPGENGGN